MTTIRGSSQRIIVRSPTGESTDAEGRWIQTFSRAVFRGRVSGLSNSDARVAAERGRTATINIRLPLEADVTEHDQITVDDGGPYDGDYVPISVVLGRRHVKVVCQRFQ